MRRASGWCAIRGWIAGCEALTRPRGPLRSPERTSPGLGGYPIGGFFQGFVSPLHRSPSIHRSRQQDQERSPTSISCFHYEPRLRAGASQTGTLYRLIVRAVN